MQTTTDTLSDIRGAIAGLNATIEDLKARNARLQAERGYVVTPQALAEIVKTMILVRKGETITEAVAKERAANVATALMGYTVTL